MTRDQDQYAELQPKTKRQAKQEKNKAEKTLPDPSATYAIIDHRLHNSISSSQRSWSPDTFQGTLMAAKGLIYRTLSFLHTERNNKI